MAEITHSRGDLHQLVDQLQDENLPSIIAGLAKIPGLRLPVTWLPKFPDIESMPYEGESPSEQLIRERR